jgi:hypothetical protein
MNPSTNINQRSVTAIAFAAAVIAIAIAMLVPVAQAQQTTSEKYGPLDPWAYSLIHRSTQGNVMPAGKYGPLDPWAYAVIHRNSVATGSNVGRPTSTPAEITTGLVAPGTVKSSRSNGVDLRDAGIGAAGTLALMLLTVGVAFAMRKRGTLAHSSS